MKETLGEKSLSKEGYPAGDFNRFQIVYPEKDVKEFIKKLKAIVAYGYHSEIDKLAGKELTNE